MDSAAAIMAQSRHRTPEEYYRAYQKYQRDIEPYVRAVVRIRSLAMPHLHLQQQPDGSWRIVSDPNEGLPPSVLESIRILEEMMRQTARFYGLVAEP